MPDLLKDCKKDPIEYIFAEDHERMVYFSDCENIAFQTRKGQDIWNTSGEGQIKLPAQVGVYIVRGKSLLRPLD